MSGNLQIKNRVVTLGAFALGNALCAQGWSESRKGPTPPVVCEDFAPQAQSPYALPYRPGQAFAVIRSTSHYTPQNGGVGLYAIDFRMPIGTEVLAARGGTVAAIQESYEDGNNQDLHENYVFIKHDDGTFGRYFHLNRNGALVDDGQIVQQGELIGRSGNSGRSGEPHLHFDVQKCGPNLPPKYNQLPCGQTLPVSFRNTRSHACGLAPNESYTALPAPPV